jgi:hypothetical protein
MKNVNSQKRFGFSDEKNLSTMAAMHRNDEGRHEVYDRKIERRNIRIIYVIVMIILNSIFSYGQCPNNCTNLIDNGLLALNNAPPTTFNGAFSFYDNYSTPWENSFGNAHHIQPTPNSPIIWGNNFNISNVATAKNCFFSSILNSYVQVEGIHANTLFPIKFNPLLTYCFKFDLTRFILTSDLTQSPSAKVVFRAANSLPELDPNIPTNVYFPIPVTSVLSGDFQQIFSQSIPSIGNYTNEIEFAPIKDFSQFQIYLLNEDLPTTNSNATASINSVSLTCKTSALKDYAYTPLTSITYRFTPDINHNACTSVRHINGIYKV